MEEATKFKQMGDEYLKGGSFMFAIDYYTKALEIKEDPECYANRASCLTSFKKYEEAGLKMGFRHVESGALVRSSYKAQKHIL